MKATRYEKEQESIGYYVYEYAFVFEKTSLSGRIEDGQVIDIKKCREMAKESFYNFIAHEKLKKRNWLNRVKNYDKKDVQKKLKENLFVRAGTVVFDI